MEEYERRKQFSYSANANLVLTVDRRSRGRVTEPSGEAESLTSRLGSKQLMERMGDKSNYASKPDIRREKVTRNEDKQKITSSTSSILVAEASSFYVPKTSDSKLAYDLLLGAIEDEIGIQPEEILKGAAEEVLEIVKGNSAIVGPAMKLEVEEMLGIKLDDEKFGVWMGICRRISDFQKAEDRELPTEYELQNSGLDEEMGVAVVFEDDAEKNEDQATANFVEEVEEYSDEEMSRNQLEEDATAKHEENQSKGVALESQTFAKLSEGKTRIGDVEIRDIDAFWLQREISRFEKDPIIAQSKADDVFLALDPQLGIRSAENKIVQIFGFEHFDFVKTLLKYRIEFYYCIKYSRASNASEKAMILAEIEEVKSINWIAPLLRGDRPSIENIKNNVDSGMLDSGSSKSDTTKRTISGWGSSYRPTGLLDLESLKFEQAGHLMSHDQWNLPKDSWKVDHKGYQEIFVPALETSPALVRSIKKIKISDMPSWAQSAFHGYDSLNLMQSKVYETAVFSAENLLLCAPTGAGKTNVALLTMLREIGIHRRDDGSIDLSSFQIVYIAPMKSLVREMVGTFSKRLGERYGLKVAELSGDQQLSGLQLRETNIIVTTPEKWDVVTRKGVFGNRSFGELVRLIIIDEIHLLHDSRGPVIESIVSRTIRQVESSQEYVRLVGLSATLPNYADVAVFLRVNPDRGIFVFDNSFRPCPLQQTFIGITHKKAFKKHQLVNEITFDKVHDHCKRGNQVIVFVHSRKETSLTARMLRDNAQSKDAISIFLRENSASAAILNQELSSVKDGSLKDLLQHGIGIHHAGLSRGDRSLVEDLFAEGHLQVLVSTATLAWGVNLPAHTVIIKGTQVYNPEKAAWMELSMLDVMQMLGRAGRPQFDSFGEGIIITSQLELKYYMSLLNEQLPVESQLISRLADALNAEIQLGTVRSIRDAVDWLGYSYLFIRMVQNPHLYSVPLGLQSSDPHLMQYRVDLAHAAAISLSRANLIRYDRKLGLLVSSDLGRIASHYYISHHSMVAYTDSIQPQMSDIEILRLFSLSSEFKYISVREQEKLELAKLVDKVPIPVKESMDESTAKINVLLQSYISRLSLEGYALIADMVYVTQSAGRLMRALFEIAVNKALSSTARKIHLLCLAIEHRMWSIESPLRQLKGVPMEIIRRLEKMNFPWQSFLDLTSAEIGELIRFQKYGKKVFNFTHMIPRLELEALLQPITRSYLRLELTITPDFKWDQDTHGNSQGFWIFVEDNDSEEILHHEFFILRSSLSSTSQIIRINVPLHEPSPPLYFVRVLSNSWIGSESILPVSFKDVLLPSKFPSATEILDLQPALASDIGFEGAKEFFNFSQFNPIQTQALPALLDSDENVFIGAPSGSGKTTCAELSILKMLFLSEDKKTKAVYMSPSERLAKQTFSNWKPRFEDHFGVAVTMLTGENSTDLKLLSKSRVFICTADQWDQISRRWRARKKLFSSIRLFLADDLQWISSEKGPTLEVVVSRMRFISSQPEYNIRIIGLSASVANGRELGEWIGASAKGNLNFHPNAKPVPLEISIQGFFQNDPELRVESMIKPAFLSIDIHSDSASPVIIFVPSRRVARRVASEFVNFAGSSSTSFIRIEKNEFEEEIKAVRNQTLREALLGGVGFYHDGLDDSDRHLVSALFNTGMISVVIVERTMCWGLDMKAPQVIILGTQYYDGREHGYIDYPISDVSAMIGAAGRQNLDTFAKCTFFCHVARKAFYSKFLFEAYPVESHLDHALADHLNSEIVAKTITDFQSCIDYLTWTFLYRRLLNNPSYYNLKGNTAQHLSDHLSELIETTLEDLEKASCISIIDGEKLEALNLGFISSYYNLSYMTVELFQNSLSMKTGLKGILDIICAANEFDTVNIRHLEEIALERMSKRVRLKVPNADFLDPHTKVHLLLQAHFSHIKLPVAVQEDQSAILVVATRLLQAMVDVISSNGWLTPAIAAMELSQMIIQGVWNDNENQLYQLPHLTEQTVKSFSANGVKDIPSLIDLDNELRMELFASLSPSQIKDIANVCNTYPDIELQAELLDRDRVIAGDVVSIQICLSRDEASIVSFVHAPRYPVLKSEGWWIIIGIPEQNKLCAIKRVHISEPEMAVNMEFIAPETPGEFNLIVYLVCDAYIGFDNEIEMDLLIRDGNSTEKAVSFQE